MTVPVRKDEIPRADLAIQPVRRAPSGALANPVILDAADSALSTNPPPLHLVDTVERRTKRESAVITGLRDLQQLQKQTVAVLEAVKGNLEDIRQVLRSPEATRGMEKQQNAAALLAKGFADEAAAQARGAVELLPANPEAHLLLALSLAAAQAYDDSLAAARKGLALFDRRQHPLAIEAGLLHAIAALGHGSEAATRWNEIIEALPLPVLMEHLGRIAVCYPSTAPAGQLDSMLERRILHDPQTKATEVPPATLLAGMDDAKTHKLEQTERAMLIHVAVVARRLKDPAEIVRFLGEYVAALSERAHHRTASALARLCVKALLTAHADAFTLYRALLKLELAETPQATADLADLLSHWRAVGQKNRRARQTLALSLVSLLAGSAIFAHAALGLQYLPAGPWAAIRGFPIEPLHVGLATAALGAIIGLAVLFRRYPVINLPEARPPLAGDEVRFLRTREVRDTLRRIARRDPESR